MFDALESVAGPAVDDTEVRFVDGDDFITLGGLAVPLATLRDDEYYVAEGNITVPPSWPVFEPVELYSNVDGFGLPRVAAGVFQQTTMVTDEDSRASLVESGFLVGLQEGAEVTHRAETTNPETGVTCWSEVRRGKVSRSASLSDRAVILFAGPDIASSGLIVHGPSSFTGTPDIVDEIVEAVCGSPPSSTTG